jgi:hypothetical protein
MINLHILQYTHSSFQNIIFQLNERTLASLPEDGSILYRIYSINEDISITPDQMNENQGPDVVSGEEEE